MGDLPILSLGLPESTDDVSKDIKAASETPVDSWSLQSASSSKYENENAITQREIIFYIFRAQVAV